MSSAATEPKCGIVIIGFGAPLRSMGWYHAKNVVDGEVPNAAVTDIVEPWLLGGGKDSADGAAFLGWAAQHPEINFHASIAALPPPAEPRLAVIAARAADCPRLFREVLETPSVQCSHVFLEKPGAASVGELEGMASLARIKGVGVSMGYNKNVTQYVAEARRHENQAGAGAVTTFTHANSYTEAELPECFERNSEGMLKNMAIHELALLVSYYGVRADNIRSVELDHERTRCLTLSGPEGGASYTDFASAGFKITTTDGTQAGVFADRTAGSYSEATVVASDGSSATFKTPDAALLARVEEMRSELDCMDYFLLHRDDYIKLKDRCVRHVLAGAAGAAMCHHTRSPEGVASIEVGVQALRLAELLTPQLIKSATDAAAAALPAAVKAPAMHIEAADNFGLLGA